MPAMSALFWLPFCLVAASMSAQVPGVPMMTKHEGIRFGEGIRVYTMPLQARNWTRDPNGFAVIIVDSTARKYWWSFQAEKPVPDDVLQKGLRRRFGFARCGKDLVLLDTQLFSFLVAVVSTPYETEESIGQRILEEVKANTERLTVRHSYREEVNLAPLLGRDFFSKPNDATPTPLLRFLSVSGTEAGLTISVTSGSRQIAHLTLSPSFQILSHRIVPPE